MESELMRELREKVNMQRKDGFLPEEMCEQLAKEYQKKIEDKIWPVKKQEQFKTELKKIITEHTGLTNEIAEKLSKEFIKKTMRKIGDTLSNADEKHIAYDWEIEITERGAICYTSKISDKKLTTELSEKTKQKLRSVLSATPKAIITTREISKETMEKMPTSNAKTWYERPSFWRILKESLIYWLTGRRS